MSNIFKPANENEIKQRHEKRMQEIIDNLISREDCIKNPDGSYSFTGDIDISNLNLKEIPIKFKRVEGFFNCSWNKLTSLKNSPEYVGKAFICHRNQLTNLDGCPKYIGGHFDCAYNHLTSLTAYRVEIKSWFQCFHNQLTNLDGLPVFTGEWTKNFKYGFIDCSGNNLSPKTLKNLKKICKEKKFNHIMTRFQTGVHQLYE